jgi:hypothetical protein
VALETGLGAAPAAIATALTVVVTWNWNEAGQTGDAAVGSLPSVVQ